MCFQKYILGIAFSRQFHPLYRRLYKCCFLLLSTTRHKYTSVQAHFSTFRSPVLSLHQGHYVTRSKSPYYLDNNEGDFAQEIWTNGSTTISQKSYWSDYFRWRNLCVQFLKVKYYSSNCGEGTFWLLNFQSRISGGNRCFYITHLQRKSIPSMAPLVGKNCTHGIFSHVVKLMKTEMKISTVVFPN